MDFVVRSPACTLAVESKYRDRSGLGAKSGLVDFCRQEGIRQAYWITRATEDFGVEQIAGLETQVLKIPAHIFVYLLGQAERLLWT